jgi:serine/threonine protein kinase
MLVHHSEVKLCDLGSCSTDHRVLRNSTEIGYAKEDIERNTTIAYRAPEQVRQALQRASTLMIDSQLGKGTILSWTQKNTGIAVP